MRELPAGHLFICYWRRWCSVVCQLQRGHVLGCYSERYLQKLRSGILLGVWWKRVRELRWRQLPEFHWGGELREMRGGRLFDGHGCDDFDGMRELLRRAILGGNGDGMYDVRPGHVRGDHGRCGLRHVRCWDLRGRQLGHVHELRCGSVPSRERGGELRELHSGPILRCIWRECLRSVRRRHFRGFRCYRLHGLPRGQLPAELGRAELFRLRFGYLLGRGRRCVRRLRAGHLPGNPGRVWLHFMRSGPILGRGSPVHLASLLRLRRRLQLPRRRRRLLSLRGRHLRAQRGRVALPHVRRGRLLDKRCEQLHPVQRRCLRGVCGRHELCGLPPGNGRGGDGCFSGGPVRDLRGWSARGRSGGGMHELRRWHVLDVYRPRNIGMHKLRGGVVLDRDGSCDLGMLELRGGDVLDGSRPCDLGVYKMLQGPVRVYAGIRCVHCNLEANHAPHHWSTRRSSRCSYDHSRHATRCVARAHRRCFLAQKLLFKHPEAHR